MIDHPPRPLSLEHVRALGIVTSLRTRLLTVHEDQEIDGKDLPDWEKLDEAKRMVEECEEYCANLARNWEKASSVEERMALGATACPEGGQVVPQPAGSGDVERIKAMVRSAQVRLDAAMGDITRLESRGGDSPASGGFDAAPPAEDYDQQWSDAGSTPSTTWSAPARLQATPLGRAVPGIPHHPQY